LFRIYLSDKFYLLVGCIYKFYIRYKPRIAVGLWIGNCFRILGVAKDHILGVQHIQDPGDSYRIHFTEIFTDKIIITAEIYGMISSHGRFEVRSIGLARGIDGLVVNSVMSLVSFSDGFQGFVHVRI